MNETASPRHIIAMALHQEYCGERSPQATHPADMDCHLIDADVALHALAAEGYTVLAKDPTATTEPGIVASIRQALEDCEPVQEDDTASLLDAYDDMVNQRDAEAAARRVLRDELTAARQAYEMKVQDLAAETNRLGRLIHAVKADGRRTHEDCRTIHCGICRALREVTGAEAGE